MPVPITEISFEADDAAIAAVVESCDTVVDASLHALNDVWSRLPLNARKQIIMAHPGLKAAVRFGRKVIEWSGVAADDPSLG